jgi:hypothetical protein
MTRHIFGKENSSPACMLIYQFCGIDEKDFAMQAVAMSPRATEEVAFKCLASFS